MQPLVLSQYLDEQFFPSPRAASRAALAGNDGSHQVRVLKGRPRATSIALEHDLFWTPLVDSAEGLYFLDFVGAGMRSTIFTPSPPRSWSRSCRCKAELTTRANILERTFAEDQRYKPIHTKLPRTVLLVNPYTAGRIGIRNR